MSFFEEKLGLIAPDKDALLSILENLALDGLAIRPLNYSDDFCANPNFWKRLGYRPKQVKDKLSFWQDLIHPDDKGRESESFRKHVEDPQSKPYEPILRFAHKAGGWVWLQLKASGLPNNDSQILITFNEITELKRKEIFLSQSSDMARIGFYDWNIRAKSLYWSAMTREIHGVEADFEPDYRQAIKFYKEGRSQQKITELVDRALHYGQPFDEELQIVDSAGRDIWVRVIGIPEMQDGRALRLYGTFQDIDLHVRTENAIRSERELYRQVLQGANVGAWDWDIDSDRMTLNHKAAQMLGYNLESMRREGQVYWFDLVHEDEKARLTEGLREYLVGAREEFQMDCRLRMASGSYRWLNISGKLFQPDLHFARPRVVGIWKDIHSEKSKMSDYSTFIQEAPLAMAMMDKNMHYINCSQKWRTDYKLEDVPIIGRSHYDVFPELPERWKEDHKLCLKGETLRKDEDFFIRANGDEQWIRWEIRPWYDDQRQVGGIIMYTEDITARKKVQRKLEFSERAFAENFHNGAIGMAIVGLNGEWLEVNHKLCQILGYTAEELADKTFQDLTYPEDLEKDLSLLDKLNKGEIANYQIEKRYFRKDGSILKALLGAAAVRNQAGEVMHYVSQVIECDLGCSEEE